MVVLGGWVLSYERVTPVNYGPAGPLLQEEARHCSDPSLHEKLPAHTVFAGGSRGVANEEGSAPYLPRLLWGGVRGGLGVAPLQQHARDTVHERYLYYMYRVTSLTRRNIF
jgi:hypothetical protein